MVDTVALVDAHVHVHPGTDARALLDAPARNLAAAAGEIGFRLLGALAAQSPSQSLRERLSSATFGSVFAFGRLQGAAQFIKSQVQLRMRKRTSGT